MDASPRGKITVPLLLILALLASVAPTSTCRRSRAWSWTCAQATRPSS